MSSSPTELPMAPAQPVANCDGCGACCTGMSSPPGYAIYFPPAGQETPEWASDPYAWPDAALWPQVPDSLKQGLAEYYNHCRDREKAGVPRAEAWRDGEPCCWYDAPSGKCLHHEYRPQTCRDFELGGPACLEYRRDKGV